MPARTAETGGTWVRVLCGVRRRGPCLRPGAHRVLRQEAGAEPRARHQLLSAVAIIAPLFLQYQTFGLINTYWGVISPDVLFALPLTVYLLVAYFRELPADLEEAAKVDGASTWQLSGGSPSPFCTGRNNHGAPHLHLRLERVPVRQHVHAGHRKAARNGRHSAVSDRLHNGLRGSGGGRHHHDPAARHPRSVLPAQDRLGAHRRGHYRLARPGGG